MNRLLAYWLLRFGKNIYKSRAFRRNLNINYLKHYLYVIDSVLNIIETKDISRVCDNNELYWTMWLQEEQPEIVQLCLKSIKKYCKNTIVITEKNYNNYIDISDYILQKYQAGRIRPCFFSDYIRVCLLEKYGGTWIDGTCYLTDKVPKYILNSEFFMLQNFEKTSLSNYFIHSKPGAFITCVMKKFLEEYWKDNNRASDYFFFHLFILTAIKYNDIFRQEWNKIPQGLNYNTKLMYKILYDDYEPDLYDWLCKTSYLHKLTYKKHDEKNINSNSLYRHLITD